MKNKPETVLHNLDEFVQHVMKHPMDSRKAKISTYNSDEWDNPIAGADWEKEIQSLSYVSYHSPDREKYEQRREEINSQRPSSHIVTNYLLMVKFSAGDWRSETIRLSEELGKAILGVWTMKPRWRGSSHLEPTGWLTFPSILKRLGNTDIKDQIDQARKAEAERTLKLRRNNRRQSVRELATKLHDALHLALDEGVYIDPELFRIIDLVDLKDEE